MAIYTLYVKTHNLTGLKYLGQTTKDANAYKGSGIDWKCHLKEWGNDVTTEILYMGNDREEMKKLGRYYSDLWDVKNNVEWANRIPETGGGSSPDEGTRKLLSEKLTGKKKPPRTSEHNKKLGDATRGKPKPKTSEGLKRYFEENGFSKEAALKQSVALKQWYKENPEKAKSKSKNTAAYYKNNPEKLTEKNQKTTDSKIRKQYDRYIKIIPLILEGLSRHQILKQTGFVVRNEIIPSIKDGSHRVFHIFPELKQLL